VIHRLANVIYWLCSIVGSLWLAALVYDARDKFLSGDPDTIVLAVLPFLILYGLGWATRYILTGRRDL
jgi:hypothetical protein